ncbi:MAG: enoyl-CoA hydratase/isomerase family protein [Deltaproteobacteria bacterium]|nr:enoyl-CoA hydratase/isomerase family protein [Candidatus Anaeroferrophillacea bacterium]
MSEDHAVLLDKHEQVATLTLNRAAGANVYNREMADALWAAVQEVRWDPGVRVVLVVGAGPVFSGGGDIAAFRRGLDEECLPAEIERLTATLNATILGIRTMDKVFVSLVDGGCGGFGVGLALAADIPLVTVRAKFVAGYIGIAAVPDGGTSFAVLNALGLPRALDFFLDNGTITGPQAAAAGLVSRLLASEGEAALAEARELARRLSRGPRRAQAATKALLVAGVGRQLAVQLEAERQGLITASTSPEMAAGIAAFLARRPPDYREQG